MQRIVRGWLLLVVLGGTPALAASSDETATESLSPETRQVLVAEMQALAAAMGPLHTAVVTGDHRKAAEQAQAVHDSFVLAQQLSDAQRRELKAVLPEAFIAADRRFHTLAARLADAARNHDPVLERFFFAEMTRACLSCHREFAAGRFPGLAGDRHAPAQEHAH